MEQPSLVRLNRDASEQEVGAVADAFRELGFESDIQANVVLTAGDPVWLIWATLPLQAFLAALGAEAGKDAYTGLKRFLKRLRDAHDGDEVIVYAGTRRPLPDPGNGNQVVLRSDLPDEALEALLELDLGQIDEGTQLVWVSDEGRWVDVTASGSQ